MVIPQQTPQSNNIYCNQSCNNRQAIGYINGNSNYNYSYHNRIQYNYTKYYKSEYTIIPYKLDKSTK